MNKEIEKLLKLARIPNFQLTNSQQRMLDEWKQAQKEVVPKKRTYTRRKKTTNEVKVEEKETGKIEIEKPLNIEES